MDLVGLLVYWFVNGLSCFWGSLWCRWGLERHEYAILLLFNSLCVFIFSKPTTVQDSDNSSKRPIDNSNTNTCEVNKQKVENEVSGPVELGPKSFGSSVEMFDYFFKMIHDRHHFLNLNKDANVNALKGEFMDGGLLLDCRFLDDSSGFSAGVDNTLRRLVFSTSKKDILRRHNQHVCCIEYSYATCLIDTKCSIYRSRQMQGLS